MFEIPSTTSCHIQTGAVFGELLANRHCPARSGGDSGAHRAPSMRRSAWTQPRCLKRTSEWPCVQRRQGDSVQPGRGRAEHRCARVTARRSTSSTATVIIVRDEAGYCVIRLVDVADHTVCQFFASTVRKACSRGCALLCGCGLTVVCQPELLDRCELGPVVFTNKHVWLIPE
jgi:hypothetical protein